MDDRDEKILRHVGLYSISLRLILERLFFDANKTACGNVITRLTKQKRLVSRPRAFPGGLSYYQLSEGETKRIGVPEYRAKAPAGQALPEKLAVLWFCCMSETRRTRVEKTKLEEIFKVQPFPGPHCFELDEQTKQYRLFRVFAPSADDEYLIRHVREHIDIVTDRGCQNWLKTGTYGVAVLAETETRKQKIEREFKEKGLTSKLSSLFEVVPTPNTLKEVLNGFTQEAGPPDT